MKCVVHPKELYLSFNRLFFSTILPKFGHTYPQPDRNSKEEQGFSMCALSIHGLALKQHFSFSKLYFILILDFFFYSCIISQWNNAMNIWSTLGLLMTWCRKTKSSVAEVLRYTFQFRSIIFPRNYVVFMTLRKLWRHQMETFAALLVLCTGNSPVTGEFPAQRPVTRSFDTSMWYINVLYKSMAWHKTAVIPLQTHWSYCSLVLNHKNDGTIHKIWRPLSRPKSLT